MFFFHLSFYFICVEALLWTYHCAGVLIKTRWEIGILSYLTSVITIVKNLMQLFLTETTEHLLQLLIPHELHEAPTRRLSTLEHLREISRKA